MVWLLWACATPKVADYDDMESLMAAWEDAGFSGSVWVQREDEVLLADGYGACIRSEDIPCGPETVYDIGSLTKQFTGAAIAALEEDGLLSVEDRLGDFFPGAPADKADITVLMLLTHTAGMPDSIGGDYREFSRADLLAAVWDLSLSSEPGEEHRYSNVGYSLLGAIIEEVSGESYEDYLRHRLWLPAGMEATGYTRPDWDRMEVAHGYAPFRWGFESPLDHSWDDDGPWWHLRANGGVLSTPRDMALWHEALRDGTVLTDETVARMQEGQVRECADCRGYYAYGWVDVPEEDLRWHNGGNGVFFALNLRYLEEDLFVFTATNNARRREEVIGVQLAAIAQRE